MPSCRRPGVRGFRLFILLAASCLARASLGADAPLDYPGFHTAALQFPAPGSLIGSFGAEYVPGVTNDVAGLKGNLLRAPTIGLRLGLSENAEFQISWLAQGWLWVKSQGDPPVLGRKLNGLSSDFGDVTVATLIQLHSESRAWPAAGIRAAVQLPNSNEKLGIGDNATDFFASALLAKSLASRTRVFGNLGVGILTEPTRVFQQNDVLTYGVMADHRARRSLRLVGEVVGRIATHGGGPGTRTSHELRAGFAFPMKSLTINALVLRGLAPGDSHEVGYALHASFQTTLFRRGADHPTPSGGPTAPAR